MNKHFDNPEAMQREVMIASKYLRNIMNLPIFDARKYHGLISGFLD